MNLQRYAHTIKSDKPLIKRFPFIMGIICLGICEVFNFVALTFSPVSVIAPLGSFSIIASAIFGNFFFGEKVSQKGIIGIILITLGTMSTVINGPSNSKDLSVEEFEQLLKSKGKIIYFSSILFIMIILKMFGGKHLLPTIALASLSAGNTVTLTKAIAMFVKMSVTTKNQLTSFVPYVIILFVVGSVLLQLHCLNIAMENHKAYIVNSLYFVALTTFSIINSSILYDEMMSVTALGKFLFFIGCTMMMVGVFILSSKSMKKKTQSDTEPLLHNPQPEPEFDESEQL
ncbi:NIPA-like protein 2 [Histomonas meleagridis]|uniref:NIPA-like protein 2 n=1 Tax=Histomonas meleagridis TaxID=135588 RepID=UPI0035599A85|nr:NIPA-like protein 2 [Histomonas meleagridis]KAH0806631.1 NIPA-like protein 2 [Histomonas meleagridis]